MGRDTLKILIVDKKRITKYFIQDNIDDSCVINYKTYDTKENVIITFGLDSFGNKILKSNGVCNILSKNQVVPYISLVEYGIYVVKILGREDYMYIYTYPNTEKNIYRLSLENIDEIKIGNSSVCNIIHKSTSTNNIHAVIRKINDTYRIENVENSYVYLNKKAISHSYLKTGDMIFINGIIIIFMGKFITINNPRDTVSVVGIDMYINKLDTNNSYEPVTEEEKSVNLYKEDDYFYHTSRISEVVEEEIINIESPPSTFLQEENPFWISIGSSLTVMASTFMMIYNIFNTITNSNKSIINVLPQMFMCFAMIVAALILPKMTSRYQKKKALKNEKIRKEKYAQYLYEKETLIQNTIKKNLQILNENYMSTNQIIENIKNNKNYWYREIKDDDFLKLRLGVGEDRPHVKIEAPEKHFSLFTDELLQKVYDLVDRYKKICNVPVTYSFLEKNISALIINKNKNDYIKNILLQLVALHSPQDLKIVVLTDEFNYVWEDLKYLPHLFSDDRKLRFYATDADQYKAISDYLEQELNNRKDHSTEDSKNAYLNFDTYYLIITDNFIKTKKINIIQKLLNETNNYGFSILVIDENMKYVPKECSSFIQILDKEGCILSSNINSKNQINFKLDYVEDLDIKEITHKLDNIPITLKEGESVLPTSITFLDMYGVSKIEQLNINNRWKANNPINSLSATIGVHASGEEFKLNLHEKFHGPHGLIAGSTGSGKSEFIITYILSMAVNYHPYEVQFVLIDYKGGGLAGAFENKETKVKIPHLIGTITNLDVSEMNRTLVSIESELKRRQKIFNKVRDSLGESTIDIYKYQKLYRQGAVKEPMAHLFIISDEFAELKSQQPEFMNQLISTARIGRSLGVHLILATQKPAGVVNDQIWSNSKFKVCLKVQDRADSMGVLKRPDAASIKETGRFYLQVGYDDYFDIGQSGWAGAKYIPSDTIIKKIDDNIDFIDNNAEIIKSINDYVEKKEVSNNKDQLTNIVRYIYDLSQKQNLVIKNLWLDPLKEEILIDDLKKKYNYTYTPYLIDPIIGEYDVPQEQFQDVLKLNLTDNGNTIIFGSPGSGKENLLQTILWSTTTCHTPDEINFYIIDCGTESLGVFSKMPHVGEIASLEENEKIMGILQMAQDKMEERKNLFVEYSGNYKNYIEESGNKLPLIAIIINNYEVFSEKYSKVADSIQTFYRDGARYGVIFIITCINTNSMRSRTLQYFNNKIMLQIPNDIDYRTYLNAPKGFTLKKCFGRGAFAKDKTAYEFQTAIISNKNVNSIIREISSKLNEAYTVKAPKIPVIPTIPVLDSVLNYLSSDFIPVGFDINTKKPVSYLFKEKINLVVSNYIDYNEMDFINSVMFMLKKLNKKVVVLDLAEAYEKDYGCILYNDNFDNAIINIYNDVIKDVNNEKYYVILGAGFLKNKITSSAPIVKKLFENISKIDNSHFILFDTYASIRNLQTELWYQNINKSNGIWLGDGITNQSVINVNKISVEDKKIGFEYMAFLVQKGNYQIIKYVVERKIDDEK